VKKIILVILAVLVYGFFVVAMTPARFVVSLVELPRNIQLGTINGSVWSGHVSSINVDGTHLEAISWDVLPSHLLALNLAADITVGTKKSEIIAEARVSVSTSSQVTVDNLLAQSTVEHLTTISPLPMGLTASGKLTMNVARFVYSQAWCDTLDGHVELNHANVASSMGQVPLSHAKATLGCDQGTVSATLLPATNSLGIDVMATLSPASHLAVSGNVLPPADAPQDFVNLLQFSGRPDPQGRYPVEFKTRL